MTTNSEPNSNGSPSPDFKVIGYVETDRVFISKKSGVTVEVDIPNGAELISGILIAALGPGRVAKWISYGTSAIGHRIELAEQDKRLIARSSVQAEWRKKGTEREPRVEEDKDNPVGVRCVFVTQHLQNDQTIEDQEPPTTAWSAPDSRMHWVFMPRHIKIEEEDKHNLWRQFESSWNEPNRHNRILLLTPQVLRDAEFRLREDGATSAAVEDAWSIIAGSDSGLANMNENVGLRARKVFAKFEHIFLRIRADAVIHFKNLGKETNGEANWAATLYYAKEGDRSEWLRQRDTAFGLDAILAGAVALAVDDGFEMTSNGSSETAISVRIKEGVERMTNLIQRGYAEADEKNDNKRISKEEWRISSAEWVGQVGGIGELIWKRSTPDQPKTRAVGKPNEKAVLAIKVEIAQASLRGSWSLFNEACKPLKWKGGKVRRPWEGVYSDIVESGPEEASDMRVFKLGKLKSFDRSEVDGLAGLWRLMSSYLRDPKRPLSVGVFGAPGGGKSFAVKEIAESVLSQMPGKSVDPLEFNVAQFTSLDDLATAFHKARDRYLSTSRVPVVIFDEFDAAFGGRPFGWLQYFLMPMQDGKFKDDGEIFHTGKCIFIFCGGLNRTFDEFSSRQRDQEFCSAKGPDFISRLRGILNIPSLDPPDQPEEDGEVPKWMIRRAMLLNYQLKEHNAKIGDDAVRWAFLSVPYYRHGARSLEAIIDMCAHQPSGVIDRTSLPRRDQIELHTDAAAFWKIIRDYEI